MKRNHFLFTLGAGSLAWGLQPGQLMSQTTAPREALPAEKVKEFVGVCHSNLDRAKVLLEEFPSLIFSSWDWGGGDFETGIEAAGHVGRKDIAQYLLEKGARSNIFLFAMLGNLEFIKGYLEWFPDHLTLKGPHGFSLLHHAQKGGVEAVALVEYLQGKGLQETKFQI
jgi:hypothetical protein